MDFNVHYKRTWECEFSLLSSVTLSGFPPWDDIARRPSPDASPSSLQNCKVSIYDKLPSLWYSVIAAQNRLRQDLSSKCHLLREPFLDHFIWSTKQLSVTLYLRASFILWHWKSEIILLIYMFVFVIYFSHWNVNSMSISWKTDLFESKC